jgi:hypothetical protein
MMLINRFEGSCGKFGEGKKKPIMFNDTRLVCPKIKLYIYIYTYIIIKILKIQNNDHGVNVSMIIIII